MSFIAAAAIGAGGSLIGGLLQSGAQSNAAGIDQKTQNKIFKQEQPFITAGQGATSVLSQLLGLPGGGGGGGGGSNFTADNLIGPQNTTNPATGNNRDWVRHCSVHPDDPACSAHFKSSAGGGGNVAGTGLSPGYLTQTFDPTQQQLDNYPGYQFALKTGGQAIRNADTPGLGALSGPALKDLIGFNQNLANTYYGNYFNQFQTQQNNIFSRLSSLAGLGQNAAGNFGNQATQLGLGQGQAVAASGASLGAGLSGAANSFLLPSILGSFGGGGGFDSGAGAGVGLGFGS